MVFFVPTAKLPMEVTAMDSVTKILEGVGYGSGEEPWLPVGIGVNHSMAYVGKVGTGAVNVFTALGDTGNVAARLQAPAAADRIVVSESVYAPVVDTSAERRS
ncbi:MAG: adenylate/guanylate cyclase domain-containing protein [Dehalococcoidia bacterium]|jgi:class 3 adenylate cyclase|nr:hypothetical protein [Chloroflexota bacterium]MDP7261451.1 adenylate/guanylate cyclase domain-containing protein [Dehalococcoidia bacterium]|tara:strand:- start:593 stop:901 length:309 start_codon:yes stop_codon:yes gene_type:complete